MDRVGNVVYDIAEYYGLRPQLNQTIEECAELIQAINKCHRYGIENKLQGLTDEIADVSIMIDQIRYLLNKNVSEKSLNGYKTWAEMYLNIKNEKIRRQLQRIEAEKSKELIGKSDLY